MGGQLRRLSALLQQGAKGLPQKKAQAAKGAQPAANVSAAKRKAPAESGAQTSGKTKKKAKLAKEGQQQQ